MYIYTHIYIYALYIVTLMTKKMLLFNPVLSLPHKHTNTHLQESNIPFPEVSKLNEELSEQ